MIFTILKIIGLVVLVLLALIILCILLVLFCPIKYRGRGHASKDDFNTDIKITWIFRLIRLRFKYDEQTNIILRVLFFKKNLYETLDEDNTNELSNEETDKESKQESNEELNIITSTEDSFEEVKDTYADDGNKSPVFHVSSSEKENSKTEKTQTQKKKINFKSIFEKISNFYNKIKALIDDEECKLAFSTLKREFIVLLKSICPKQLKLKAKYSTGSPDTTGLSLGFLSMFPIGYQNRWEIEPDFESDEFYIDGEYNIKGKIYIYKILGIGIRLFLDKNCRKLYNKINS